jgi:PAS domain S-box-containing protein
MELGRRPLSWNITKLDSPFHTVILVCLAATLSYFVARLGGALIIRPQLVSPLWLGNVLLVSVLLLAPRRIWPILLAATLIGFFLYDLQTGEPIRSIVWLILSNVVEVLTAAACLRKSFGGVPRLNSVTALAKYSFYAVFLAPFVGAFLGALSTGSNYWASWQVAFFSEALGFLTLMPAILGWIEELQAWKQKPRAYHLEGAGLLVALVILGLLAFAAPGKSSAPALLYSLVPFLLWAALRFGSTGVSTSMIAIAFVSIWGAVHGRGPFTGPGPLVNVLSLQLFLFFTAAPFMALAALVEERKRAEEKLRESEERFRLAAQAGKMFAYEWDATTDVIVRSGESAQILGIDEATPTTSQQVLAKVHPDDRERLAAGLDKLNPEKPYLEVSYRMIRPNGTVIWVGRNSRAHFDERGRMLRIVGMVADITERKATEEALRESEERLRLAVKAGRMYAFEWDPATDVIVRTGQCKDILDWMDDPTRDTGCQFVARVHPDDREAYAGPVPEPTPENPVYQTSYRVLRPDGSVIWLEANGRVFFDCQGRRLRVIGMVADITARKLAEEALSSVSRRLIEAQEQERSRIARELHDDLGQRMALLQIGLEQFDQDTAKLSSQARHQLRGLAEAAEEVSSNIHNLSHQLHPSKLDTLGLVASLDGLSRELSNQHTLAVRFVHHDIPGQIPKDVTLCLFRIVQEALRNVVKHSGAADARVDLSGHDGRIDLCIADSGAGFSPESANGVAGLGLISMRERLRLVGGQLSIESSPLHGTRIRVRVPLFTAKAGVINQVQTRKVGA